MRKKSESPKGRPSTGVLRHVSVDGLEEFIGVLEKNFFSKVKVQKHKAEPAGVDLVISLKCDLTLVEVLHHFNRGIWGGFESSITNLQAAFESLTRKNPKSISIAELSLELKDTSVIVNRIFENSIPSQLHEIFLEIGEHYVRFTKGLTEIPYEIYVPVFDEDIAKKIFIGLEQRNAPQGTLDYFSFWGLYFASEDDAVIYDVQRHAIIRGDLYMVDY